MYREESRVIRKAAWECPREEVVSQMAIRTGQSRLQMKLGSYRICRSGMVKIVSGIVPSH